MIGPILLVAAILATTPAVVEAQAKKVAPVDEGSGRHAWMPVQLADGRTGWVASEFIRSPVDYRAIFARRAGRWLLEALIAGD